jgi:hypothetical protein
MIYDDDINEWREEAKKRLNEVDTFPGVFGELQRAKVTAEIELTAMNLQTKRSDDDSSST